MARPRVLLTGFGPFPGVAENPSGWLAETIATRQPSHDCDLHVRTLPTEWEAVAALTPRLHETVQPHVMIHFGVSPQAETIRIERSAHNRVAPRADARSALPRTPEISSQGAMRLETGLPVTALAAHLRTRGVGARPSRSGGRYLCNFLYYRSLQWAQARGRNALFVHVPLLRPQGGPLSEQELLRAAHETLRFVLNFAAAQKARPAHPQSPLAPRAGELQR